jgi:hypothetical protein
MVKVHHSNSIHSDALLLAPGVVVRLDIAAAEVGSLAHSKTACLLAQIGLANPRRVEQELAAAGFASVRELARQQRTTTVSVATARVSADAAASDTISLSLTLSLALRVCVRACACVCADWGMEHIGR